MAAILIDGITVHGEEGGHPFNPVSNDDTGFR